MQMNVFPPPSQEALGSLTERYLRFHRWLERVAPSVFRRVSSLYFFADGAIITTPRMKTLRVIEGERYVDVMYEFGSVEDGPGPIFLFEAKHWLPKVTQLSLTDADLTRLAGRLEEYSHAKRSNLYVQARSDA